MSCSKKQIGGRCWTFKVTPCSRPVGSLFLGKPRCHGRLMIDNDGLRLLLVGLYGWLDVVPVHTSVRFQALIYIYIYICYIGFFFTTCRHGLLFFSIEDFSNPRKLGTLRNQSCWGIIFQDTVRSQRWLPRLMRTNLEPQGARGVSHLVLPKKRLGYAVCGRYKIGTIPVYHPMPQKNQNYQLYKSLNG